jgi:hypothetical protein
MQQKVDTKRNVVLRCVLPIVRKRRIMLILLFFSPKLAVQINFIKITRAGSRLGTDWMRALPHQKNFVYLRRYMGGSYTSIR